VLLTLAAIGALAQERARKPAPREILEAHLSHGIGQSPFDSGLWRDETNAEILVRAGTGARITSLLDILDDRAALLSRMRELEHQKFLVLRPREIRTTFPIVIERDRERYMRLVSDAAARIDEELRGEWQTLLDDLGARGWTEWAYHFVWSQTMDSGFAWVPMMQRGLVPPLSRLIVWVVYPAHPFKTGTNYYPDSELREQMLAVTWRPGAADTTGRLGIEWAAVVAGSSGAATGDQLQRLRALGLADANGGARVPVVRRSDALYSRLESLGRRHVDAIVKHLDVAPVRRLADSDENVAFAMGYHDVSWEILRRMVERGMLSPPPALRPGAAAGVSLAGTCAIVDAHPGMLAELKKALGVR
jgi:hypothetical protein